jgi:hypothetical protein
MAKVFIKCECGRGGNVDAALSGKSIKCPACGRSVNVFAGGQASQRATNNTGPGPLFYMSGRNVTLALTFGGLILTGILFVAGPLKVWHQWDASVQSYDTQVKDVLCFALEAYLSQEGWYNPASGKNRPEATADVNFSRPLLVMSMPSKVYFTGATNVGPYSGSFCPSTGECDIDASYGAFAVGGMLTITRATHSFHFTGRERGDVSAEVNGKKLIILYPPKIETERVIR